MADSFAETESRASSNRDSFAFRHRSSLQGQWASEKAISDDDGLGTGQSGRTKITNEITEEDFSGNPQLKSASSQDVGPTEDRLRPKPDINDL